MELKRNFATRNSIRAPVLIVLYGIETVFLFQTAPAEGVLIVLYGIETGLFGFSRVSTHFIVLIVLYGIETQLHQRFWRLQGRVLIVLYGIETSMSAAAVYDCSVLIVLYGIETLYRMTKRATQ